MIVRRLVAIILIVAAVTSCNRRAKKPSAAVAGTELSRASNAVPAEMRTLGYVQDKAAAAPAPQPTTAPALPTTMPGPVQSPRKLIRTAQLALEVPSYDRASEAVARAAEEAGGYVSESRAARGEGGQRGGSVTVRVPSERFAALVAELKRLGTVSNESVSSQDVTKAYTDLETRLRVKRDAAERVRAILNTRTARLADVLEAERELARLTEEIEGMEGERRFYDQQIALSTIAIELREPSPLLGSGPLQPIREALHESVEVLATSVAALIYAVVFLTPWLALAWVLWRIVRWGRRRRAAGMKAATSGGTPGGPA